MKVLNVKSQHYNVVVRMALFLEDINRREKVRKLEYQPLDKSAC